MTFEQFFNISSIHFILAVFVSILNAVILVMVAGKFFQILQISGYKFRGYKVWLKDTKAKYISRLTMLSLLSLACVLVVNFLFNPYSETNIFCFVGLVFYLVFSIIFIVRANAIPQKTPLVQTRRMSRLMSLLFILSAGIGFGLVAVSTVLLDFLGAGILVLTPILVPLLVPLVHFMMIPLEELIRYSYILKAKKRLKKFPNLIKIGLTGSYGKTSVKYILNKMLGEKFNVCITPHSFNTPMGVTKVVLKYLKKDHELLIVEMGAKNVGDIKYLCDIVHPQHAVITGIGSQHYETFGSEENIARTKNELVKSLPPTAVCVFNGDSPKCLELYEKCTLENKFVVGLTGETEVKAQNVEYLTSGISFDLCYQGKCQKCYTVLLGKHNLLNILLASTLALKLGVSLEQIAEAVKDLEPVAHRLELSVNGNITILDDAYSSNEEGAMSALEVLSGFKESVKVCVTPGLVELGAKEFQANVNYGKALAKACDYVIIVNKVNHDALVKGLKEENFDEAKILPVENLDLAKKQIKEITQSKQKYTILFANDLPDNYT